MLGKKMLESKILKDAAACRGEIVDYGLVLVEVGRSVRVICQAFGAGAGTFTAYKLARVLGRRVFLACRAWPGEKWLPD